MNTRGFTFSNGARTLATVIKGCLLGAALGVLIGFAAFSTIRDHPRHTPPPPPTAAQVLLQRHDCWTGEAPADMRGKIPGHVVVLRDGVPFYGGPKLTGRALDQLFGGKPAGLDILAFCR